MEEGGQIGFMCYHCLNIQSSNAVKKTAFHAQTQQGIKSSRSWTEGQMISGERGRSSGPTF